MCKEQEGWAVVVVAQLVERSLLTSEVRSSNPGVGQIYIERLLPTELKFKRRKEKKKRPFMRRPHDTWIKKDRKGGRKMMEWKNAVFC